MQHVHVLDLDIHPSSSLSSSPPESTRRLARRSASSWSTKLHSALVYHRAVFSHAVQIAPVALGVAALLITLNGFIALLALAITEVALVVLAPRSARFRRSVDRRIERRRRIAAANARMAVLSEMNPVHAKEFIEIERLAWETREQWMTATTMGTSSSSSTPLPLIPMLPARTSIGGGSSGCVSTASATDVMVDRSLVIEKLLSAYLRLAVAQRNRRMAFSPERRKELDLELAAMAMACTTNSATTTNGESDEWAARRRAIVELREATWKAAADDDRIITEALATIASIVRWVHEVCATPLFLNRRTDLDVDQILEGCLRPLAFAEDLPPYHIDMTFLEQPPPAMVPSVATVPVS